VTDSLATSVEEPFADRSTFGWRVELWQAYLFEFLTASDLQKLTGMGFGNQAVYAVDIVETSDAAHNYYISVLNRTGILGFTALIAAYISLLRRLRFKLTAGRWNYGGLLLGIVVSQLVYYLVYSPSPDQGLLAGAVIGIGGARRCTS
jgi:O-antigen ligase